MQTFQLVLPYLIGLSLLAVIGTLFGGLAAMSRSGAQSARRSNLLMRARVVAQATALGLIALWFVLSRSG